MIKLDEELLASDLLATSNALYYTRNNNLINNNYNPFLDLNETLIFNFGKIVLLDNDLEDINKIIDKEERKSLQVFVDYINESQDIVYKLSKSFLRAVKRTNFFEVPFFDNIRGYSEEDFKDLILGYYSTFGNDTYKIASKYFDERRINFGTFTKMKDCAAFFSGLQWIDSGYILSMYQKYNSASASTIVHELGHAYDAERFLFPQKKNLPLFSDCLVEVPSTAFELGFYDYLKDNHIDIDGSNVLLNSRFYMLIEYLKTLKDTISHKDLAVFSDGYGVDEENNEYNVRDAVLYGLGYYTSIHLNAIRRADTKEFLNVLNKLMTSRKELSFEEAINTIGFSLEDFTNGRYVKPELKNNMLELKKRYKL